jgi:hypothetical protein
MLARDAASQAHAELEDLTPQLLHLLQGSRHRLVVENQRMEVAVAGVEHIGHRVAVLAAEALDFFEDIG